MNKVCRLCLEEGVLTSVFTKNFNVSLSEMIEYCSNIKINRNDGFPEHICSNCIYKLGVAYHFKQTCENGELRLRQYLGLPKFERYTDAAVMTEPMTPLRQTIIKRCKCRSQKRASNYKRKTEQEKLKRGPKPKPKRVHSCYHCEKEFRCQAQLAMHIRTHTGDKPFQCMYCPRSFTQKHNLTIHLRIHTGEKPFKCDICSKTFAAQGNLQAHVKIHTGQKDHICSMCTKRFITSSELTRHMNKHKCSKDFKCDSCDKTYKHIRHLKTHRSKMHEAPTRCSPETQNDNMSDTTKKSQSYTIDIIAGDIEKELRPRPNKHECEKNTPKTSNLSKSEQNIPTLFTHQPY